MTRIGQAVRAAQRRELEMGVCRRGGLVSRPGCVELAVRQKRGGPTAIITYGVV